MHINSLPNEPTMSDLTFQMLLQCHYTGDENDIDQLHIEHLVENDWQELELNINSPGFDIFIYSVLTCQNTHFKNNAAEYGLLLDSCEGLITVIADEHRSISTMNIEFKGKLKSGNATQDAVDSIVARMRLCPVSINLKDIPNNNVSASFEPV